MVFPFLLIVSPYLLHPYPPLLCFRALSHLNVFHFPRPLNIFYPSFQPLVNHFPQGFWNTVLLCCCLVTKSCLTLCDPMDCSLPGSSIHGISQAKIPEWVAISFSRGSSWPRDRTHVCSIGRQSLYCWATREASFCYITAKNPVSSQRP